MGQARKRAAELAAWLEISRQSSRTIFLESEVEKLKKAVSHAYVRGRSKLTRAKESRGRWRPLVRRREYERPKLIDILKREIVSQKFDR
jgi:hypothetical protein